jgi:hypothetical protein
VGNLTQNISKDLLTVTQMLSSFESDIVPVGTVTSASALLGGNTQIDNATIINLTDAERALYQKITRKIIRECINQGKTYLADDNALNTKFKNNLN